MFKTLEYTYVKLYCIVYVMLEWKPFIKSLINCDQQPGPPTFSKSNIWSYALIIKLASALSLDQ